MLLGIVAADQPGDVSVEVTADGLKSSSVSFKAK
jgi:hypothetical protein